MCWTDGCRHFYFDGRNCADYLAIFNTITVSKQVPESEIQCQSHKYHIGFCNQSFKVGRGHGVIHPIPRNPRARHVPPESIGESQRPGIVESRRLSQNTATSLRPWLKYTDQTA